MGGFCAGEREVRRCVYSKAIVSIGVVGGEVLAYDPVGFFEEFIGGLGGEGPGVQG